MQSYDHREHAGNAGDICKHLLLLEVADYLMDRGLAVYAESHAGRPMYRLANVGEWQGGVGRCWRHLPSLRDFSYFRILADLNPDGLRHYPGSTGLILEACGRRGAEPTIDIWDIDPEVASAWRGRKDVKFHSGDGFSGVGTLLDRSPPGLLLIDPPSLHPATGVRAEELLRQAEDKGWMALCWYMMGADSPPGGNFPRYEIKFAPTGMECGRWSGAVMVLAGSDEPLRRRLEHCVQEFLEIMRPTEPF